MVTEQRAVADSVPSKQSPGVKCEIMKTTPTGEDNFLDHYFLSIYNKLEADALLFNRKLPHAGLVGSENEKALAELLRLFLPPRFGVENSGIVIDRHGGESKQCDIIIFDNWNFPSYLKKVFPVELVYGVIEVKTNITAAEAKIAIDNLESVAQLDFHPLLTSYWTTRSKEEGIQAVPPFGMIFGYRSEAKAFETFSSWFPLSSVLRGRPLRQAGDDLKHPEIRNLTVSALDKGMIMMESSNHYVQRWVSVSHEDAIHRSFATSVRGKEVPIDPAKVLFTFLENVWQHLWEHKLHPGFDIRTYLSSAMDTFLDMGGIEAFPETKGS